jgi:hypothetical protein
MPLRHINIGETRQRLLEAKNIEVEEALTRISASFTEKTELSAAFFQYEKGIATLQSDDCAMIRQFLADQRKTSASMDEQLRREFLSRFEPLENKLMAAFADANLERPKLVQTPMLLQPLDHSLVDLLDNEASNSKFLRQARSEEKLRKFMNARVGRRPGDLGELESLVDRRESFVKQIPSLLSQTADLVAKEILVAPHLASKITVTQNRC